MYSAKPVLEVSNQFDIHTCDNLANWTAGTDTENVQLVTDHVTGFKSVEFDKTGTTVKIGSISSVISDLNGKDLKPFALHKVRMLIKLDITDVASVQLRLGTDSSNYREWEVADSSLTTNVWNAVEFDCDGSSYADTGNGIDWRSVKYIYVGVTLDAISDTLNNVRVDCIDTFKKSPSGGTVGTDVNIVGVNGSTPNFAKETGGGIASLDTKQGTTGEAAAVAGTRAAQLRYIGDAIEAARALLATIDADTSKITACNTGAVVVASGAITETNSGTIAGDTTSIDGKIPADPAKESGKLTDIDTKLNELKADVRAVTDYSTLIGKSDGNGADFTVAYASATTLTLGTLPDGSSPAARDIEAIQVYDTSGDFVEELAASELTLSVSGATLTVTGFTASFASDDEFIIRTNVSRLEAYDSGLDVKKTTEQDPINEKQTTPVAYTTLTPDDTTYDEGDVIDTRGYNHINFAYSKTVSTDDNNYIKVVYLRASDSAVDYQETYLTSPTAGVSDITPVVYEVDKAALVNILTLPTKGFPYMRIDIAKATDDGDDSAFTTYVSKSYL